jgi:hypothetical protein
MNILVHRGLDLIAGPACNRIGIGEMKAAIAIILNRDSLG